MLSPRRPWARTVLARERRLLKTGEESLFVTVTVRITTAHTIRMSLSTSDTAIQLPAFLNSRFWGYPTGTFRTGTSLKSCYSHEASSYFLDIYIVIIAPRLLTVKV
jgi:hypothetical protein